MFCLGANYNQTTLEIVATTVGEISTIVRKIATTEIATTKIATTEIATTEIATTKIATTAVAADKTAWEYRIGLNASSNIILVIFDSIRLAATDNSVKCNHLIQFIRRCSTNHLLPNALFFFPFKGSILWLVYFFDHSMTISTFLAKPVHVPFI